jgi:hypothetical protein
MRPPTPDTHTAFAQEVDRYAAERMAATAAAKWSVPDFIDTDLGCQVG